MKTNEMSRNDLILAICREAGDVGDDVDLLDGYRSNYGDDYLATVVELASRGDVAALALMRSDAGLPIIR